LDKPIQGRDLTFHRRQTLEQGVHARVKNIVMTRRRAGGFIEFLETPLAPKRDPEGTEDTSDLAVKRALVSDQLIPGRKQGLPPMTVLRF
jgi:hypothetical protein